MSRSVAILAIALWSGLVFPVLAGGISVDAGLTPGQDRWILRSQYRYMEMSGAQMSTNMQRFPMVVAYGLTPDITILGRTMMVRVTSQRDSVLKQGIGDPFVLTKFKVLRQNTPGYILGIAVYAGSNVPVGEKEISPDIWSPETGFSISFRPRFLSVDFTTSYTAQDIGSELQENLPDLLSMNIAFSALIPINRGASTALSPVLECTYLDELDRDNDLVLLSPGLQFIYHSFIAETLLQIPLYSPGNHSSDPRLIAGLRMML